MLMRKFSILFIGVMLVSCLLMAQRTIKGKVTDELGLPVQKASVVVKGTTTGTVTNSEGVYSLTVPGNAKVLVISSVDMNPEEVTLGTSNVINVTLRTSERAMTEIVVTAFGIKKDRRTLGYGVSQLNTQQVVQAHTTNITNALQGKIPGVRISGSGGAFTGSNIIIRGYTTFTGSNQPLFVVDGIPIDNSGGSSPLQLGPTVSNRAIDLNQDDIETISVLKGPSAAALYGSRASNGVILITTKKAKPNQKGLIEFSTSYQMETVNRFPDYQNSYAQGNNGLFSPVTQFSWGPPMGTTVNNAWNPDASTPATSVFNKTEVLTAYPNNVKDMFRNGNNTQANISFASGSDRSSFRFSYGILYNTWVLDNNRLTRHNFSLNNS